MRSLPSRDLIADSLETICQAQVGGDFGGSRVGGSIFMNFVTQDF